MPRRPGYSGARSEFPWPVLVFGALSVGLALYLAGSVSTTPNRSVLEMGPDRPTATALAAPLTSPPIGARSATAPTTTAPTTTATTITAPTPRRPATAAATRTAPATAARPSKAASATTGSTCTYHYAFHAVWNGGFTASVTLRNTSTISLTGWDARFTLNRSVGLREFWGANLEHVGNTILVTPASDVTLAAGASVAFGFNGASASPVAGLNGFRLAGLPCRKV